MLPEFNLNPESTKATTDPRGLETPEERARWERYLKTRLEPEERDRLERLLLERLANHLFELGKMINVMGSHWNYEDHFYRYYHQSFKVYQTQETTKQAVKLLRQLLPERELNSNSARIIQEGTGKIFDLEHNSNWDSHTRPTLEAYAHSKFMIEMAARYANLKVPPQPMPSGYAALLYLYDLR